MDAIQQRCRPKHQVLVLKCYPRTAKGAVDVKPNSSELSYLLFYALSRRSKIQKIGLYLEKKTAKDVWRQRIGNVQVTLQILTALIEKSAKDVALIAPCVLKILDQILRSNDITMVESSVPTLEAFCEHHHDASALFADQAYLHQYEAVVRAYASLASTTAPPAGKNLPSKPVALRWRNVGLQAIMAVASADALASVAGRQLDVIVPMVLENLWGDREDLLDVLLQRARVEEKEGAGPGRPVRRRNSIATVRTTDEGSGPDPYPNPIALSGTALDVDKLAEEDIGVLAMQCLEQIFVVPNRPQILLATVSLLGFVAARVAQGYEVVVRGGADDGRDCGWAVGIFELVAGWAPVQDRYVILTTAMDTLSKTPVRDDTLQTNLVLACTIGSLLSSGVNLIGLGVMDVLLGLVQQMRRVVQLPSAAAAAAAQSAAASGEEEGSRGSSAARQAARLLSRLQQCVGDLATHVYYADQIPDMIAAILLKLKPGRSASSAASTPLLENGDPPDAAGVVDAYFSQSLAKVSALAAVKAILLVANPQSEVAGAGNISLSRHRVPIRVWEGTHWLLRDPDGPVRRAYADALLTWLERETTAADAKAAAVDDPRMHRASVRSTRDLHPGGGGAPARRAVSSASNRERPVAGLPRSHFLALLHLAIYDNALQHVDHESDYVLLHVLLAGLVVHLGVNAARYGLPMVFRLQEDIQEAEAPVHKVRIGSLCHGYFWALSERFRFDDAPLGRAVHDEISRRRSKGFWIDAITVPPPPPDAVGTPGVATPEPKMPLREIESEALIPFDERAGLVDAIADGYRALAASPATSPTASPGRTMAVPILGAVPGHAAAAATTPRDRDAVLPNHLRDQMLGDWTREATILAIQEGSKSESLSGSRAGTTATRNRLGINGGLNGSVAGLHPSLYGSQPNLDPHALGMIKIRRTSVRSGVSLSPPSPSSRGGGLGIASVEQLKMALSGHVVAPPPLPRSGIAFAGGTTAAAERDEDSNSDSLMSYDTVHSEFSSMPPTQPTQPTQPPPPEVSISASAPRPGSSGGVGRRSLSRDRIELGPLNSHPPHGLDARDDRDAPPVPPLPSLAGLVGKPADPGLTRTAGAARRSVRGNTRSRFPDTLSLRGDGFGPVGLRPATSAGITGVGDGSGAMDLQELLRGIGGQSGEGNIGTVTKPPY